MTLRRTIAVASLVAAVALVALLARDGAGRDRVLRADFPGAVNVVTGAEVRAGGVPVGVVNDIRVVGHNARLTLRIDDARLWPLHRGTTAQLRIGGNVSYANRYVELVPGPSDGAELPADAVLATTDTDVPVEVDELLDAFDPATREGLGDTIDRATDTVDGRGDAIRAGLGDGGEAFEELAATLDRATTDPAALETLVRDAHRTVGALARHDARLGELVDGAADTLTALADGDVDLRATLTRLPTTLRAARGALDRLGPPLSGLDAVVRDVRPGAARLRATVPTVATAVDELGATAPGLGRTLTRLRTAAPTVTGMLVAAGEEGGRLEPALSRIAPMTACIRGYTPEIVGFFSTWGALTTHYDHGGRFAYLNGQVLPIANGPDVTSAEVVSTFPQMRYSLVRPRGLNVGRPLYDPACGTPRSSADAAADPESLR
ncbi:MAG: MlaD family protein [Solirubrobacteraceae bacterium]|nr:MlaD family protein [Solirubrobacteraceae bacterium]